MNGHEITTTGSLLRQFSRSLREAGVPSPDADARWLIAHVSGGDPHRDGQQPVSVEAVQQLEELVSRRAAREPLQLIVGHTAFRTLNIACRSGVFIPRPETEQLVEHVLRLVSQFAPPVRIVEPCTGTGAISCSLAAETEQVEILATDIDPAAVELARHNVERILAETAAAGHRAGLVHVVTGDLFDALPHQWRGTVSIVAANPPYLPAADAATWEPEVRRDPLAALVGGADGHEIVDRLLADALAWLQPGGWVVVEIDARRCDDALTSAHDHGYGAATVEPDLGGMPRILRAQAPA